jgi:hypothetical protein
MHVRQPKSRAGFWVSREPAARLCFGGLVVESSATEVAQMPKKPSKKKAKAKPKA